MMLPIQLPTNKPDSVWNNDVPIVQVGNTTHCYLTTDIGSPYMYDELCHTLLQAEPHESITLHINTGGGDLDSAIRIHDAITRCKAPVLADLSGTVASAGTMITMACDDLRIAPHTAFMVHYYSAGLSGKGQELKQQQSFMERSLNNLMFSIYDRFLTEEEIESTIDGTDYWFDAYEVESRWAYRTSRTDIHPTSESVKPKTKSKRKSAKE